MSHRKLFDFNISPSAPERALLHPLFIVALLTLAFNDHVLKGALEMGWLTGKLSDFAGMLVAPILLATLLRLKSWKGLVGAHVAVGVVFAALQLSPAFAAFWGSLFETFAWGWVTWSDPTDLIALPMLAVSALIFGRAAGMPAQEKRASSRRVAMAAQTTLACTGVIFCMATSPPPCDPELDDCYGPIYCPSGTIQDIDGNCIEVFSSSLYFHNRTSTDQVIRIRQIGNDVSYDCAKVRFDPDQHLSEALFTTTQTWTVPPQTSVALPGGSSCGTALLEGDQMPQALVFYNTVDFPQNQHYAEPVFDESTLPSGGIIVRENQFDTLSFEQIPGDPNVLFKLRQENEGGDECVAVDEAKRLDWSPLPFTDLNLEVSELELGEDGCFGLTLNPGDHPTLSKERWFACIPPELFPFENGDLLKISTLANDERGANVIQLERVGSDDPDNPRPYVSMTAWRDVTAMEFEAQALGLNATYEPQVNCLPHTNFECGTTTQAHSATFADMFSEDIATLVPGESVDLERFDDTTRQIALVHLGDNSVVASACSAYARPLGLSLDLVVLDRQTVPEELPGEIGMGN